MFVLEQKETYLWPVQIKVPANGGKYETHTFDVEFKRLSQSRIKNINEEIQAEKSEITDSDLVKEVICGWKGIQDSNGAEVPFSVGQLEMLLDIPLVASSIVKVFFESISGAKIKN